MVNYEGRIIEYLHAGELRLALVTRQTGDRLQLVDERGKHDRVSGNHVLLAHEGGVTADEFLSLAPRLRSDIDRVRQEVDTELLWESLRDELREFNVEELAENYFGTREPRQLSALFRALSQDTVHFKRKGLRFSPRPPQQVSEQRLALRRRQEKEAFRQRALRWIQQVLTSDEGVDVPAEMVSLLQQTEDFLLRKKSNHVAGLLDQASPALTAQEAAFRLLVRTGRLDADADPFLVVAGIDERLPRKVLELADRLTPFQVDAGRRQFPSVTAFSIDDEQTREIDDALTVELSGGHLRVGIHIADVAHFVAKADPLDEQAQQRSVSIYLPTRTVTMFPERLACDLASLNQGQWRPTMSFQVEIDEAGQVRDWQLCRGQLRVARRLSYAEADHLIQSAAADEVAGSLKRLFAIARRLTERRLAQGAIIIRRPVLKVQVQDDEVTLKVIDPGSPSRLIISELMILANWLAAQYAVRQGVPVIFRTQDPPSGDVQLQGREVEEDPLAWNTALKALKRSRLSLSPQPHAALGLEAYTQLTSPLRRFADVVIQRQIAAHLAGRPLPYERDELMRVLGTAETAEREMRAIERQATRCWLLKYLASQPADALYEAFVVDKAGGGYILELRDYFLRGYVSTGVSHQLGARLRVGIERIDPRRGVLRLIEVD